MSGIDHSGAKSVTPGGSVAGGHTPGPWQMGFGPSTGQRCIWGPGDPERTAPWICGEIVNRREFAQGEANARLIASAPCLLDALQGAIGALEFSQDYHRDLGNEDQAFAADRLDAARAAIAKATAGETRNAEGAL